MGKPVEELLPKQLTIPKLAAAAEDCEACDLHARATQTVFGEGGALEAAGIDRTRVYVTNIVKHFKWVARGKRRIHQSPNQTEVLACRPWLQAEILVVKPEIIVAWGRPRPRP